MPERWWKSLPASGAAVALVVGLWVWRAETASGLERVWIGAMAISTGFALWGLARALQTRGWVGDEQHRNPRLDYAAARAVAQTHAVTHACILTTTVALLLFGLVAASTVPANPGARPTQAGLALTAALLLVGAVKTFLNVYLVIREHPSIALQGGAREAGRMSGGHTERIWRCSCGGPHFLSVRYWADGELYLFAEEYPEAGHWERLRACWRLLRGRRHTWIELLLTEEQARAVAAELLAKVGDDG